MNASRMTGLMSKAIVAFLLAAVIMVSLGVTTLRVEAGKNGTNGTVAERTQSQREACDINGGKFAVKDGPEGSGGNTTECKGGSYPQTCINTPSETKCQKSFVQPQEDPRLGGGELAGAEVTTEPGSLPEIHTAETIQVEIAEGPLVVDPGTESDAPLGGKVLQVEIAVGDGSVIPILEIDEEP